MSRYEVIKTEIDGDPLGRNYSGMSDIDVAVDMNIEYRSQQVEEQDPTLIHDVIDATEYDALVADDKQEVFAHLSITTRKGTVSVAPDTFARDRLVEIFGAGSATIIAILALITEAISRGRELGVGAVNQGDVEKARALP
jgi:hypothetical protein